MAAEFRLEPLTLLPSNCAVARIRDRTRFPPQGGFHLLLPELGMSKPVVGSWTEVLKAFNKVVKANPELAVKHGWPTDWEAQEVWLDQREAQRMIAHNWLNFVELDGDPPPPSGRGRAWLAGAAGAASDALTGLAIYRELFTVSKPVPKEEAERRASICVVCPLNKPGSFKDKFVAHIAKGLTELVALMRDRDLTTSHDKELGTCEACRCPLRPKCFVELPVIQKNMSAVDRANLDPKCWIINPPAGFF